jgi:NADH:ubiquinone oxidoreductase subunit 2 (subunit N)
LIIPQLQLLHKCPPAGFMGKFYLFSAAVQADLTWLAIIDVLNSVLSAFFYLRVIVVMYMQGTRDEGQGRLRRPNPSAYPGPWA